MGEKLELDSISQIHEMIEYEKPKHPLITLIETSKIPSNRIMPLVDRQILSNLYSINLKNGQECELLYGRNHYDFEEGSMMFTAPGQCFTPFTQSKRVETDKPGWSLIFHPDLIRKSSLARKINEYTFFSYDSHEALHLSDQEIKTVTKVVMAIKDEYSQNIDVYSQDLIISNLELLLNYGKRYYGRQFITRSNMNKDIVIKFEDFLRSYFQSQTLESQGIPKVKYCAREMGYSSNYLSDLLKKETGKNTQEHIYFYLIEKAKNLLLASEDPVSSIAYLLGFEYPQHFSKLFKNKTGMSPTEYRK
ncbi:MAG: helix-turn-helix domain-containing protein [Spirochaetaceae bacterium]|jgi:AraC-like DNA-binding protein|nr:helix-turn-helix domain-containing protein [Spirochaetaceae bacterium]